jgi:glycosyltransferase involved in cell wall biosynthesis
MDLKNLTLLIPAKFEADSLPRVLEELNDYDLNIVVVLEESDHETIESIKNYNLKIVKQKNYGYGSALIEGVEAINTEYLCIFNADGSFQPKDLKPMIDLCENSDFIFASRYRKNAGSDDDTLLTKIGNFCFTLIGKIFFSLKISDILYTYVLGKTSSFKQLDLKSKNFNICVELPIKAERNKMSYTDFPSKERPRIAGFKKVNEFRDGFNILYFLIESYFNKKK